MAYNNNGYYPYQDPRAYSQNPQQQYQPQGQSLLPSSSPHRIEVQIPRASQYDGASSLPPVGVFSNPQYQQQWYAQQPQQQPQQHQQHHYQQQPKQLKPPSTPTSAKSSKKNAKDLQKPTVKPKAEPREIDYALLLIDLAENYLSAAYGNGKTDSTSKELDYTRFCKLIATGLGCLEVVLKQWTSTLQPSVEAAMRLRYASVLFQETDNFMEAEEALSKGILQCERYKLYDLKYNMQHLLARISYKTNPRAAVKFLDAAIKNAEAEQHIAWLYALRFLRVSFSYDMNQPQETLAAFNQLKILVTTANSKGDVAVAATACAIEALAHISRSNSSESIEQAQRALASVRSAQMGSDIKKIPNLTVMAHFVDLTCSLLTDEYEMAMQKMKVMHVSLEDLRDSSGWISNGVFKVPVSQTSSRAGGSTHGPVLIDKSGRSYLQLKWLPKDEIYTLGYMLSAAVTLAKNPQDRMAENFLKEAMVQLESVATTSNNLEQTWRQPLRCQAQVSLVFALCGRSAWGEAKKELATLKDMQQADPESTSESPLQAFILYLDGMICQGTGDSLNALSIYSHPLLSISPPPRESSTTTNPSTTHDLSLLAALNIILIIHLPTHPQNSRLPSLLTSLASLSPSTSQSRNLRAAHYLILSLAANTSNELLKTKENLSKVLTEAKVTANNQLMCIALNFMTEKFFKGMMGEQALKSARTAVNMARRQKNDLWTSVADGLLAESLEVQGMGKEAVTVREEARVIAGRLPGGMQVEEE